MAEVDKTAPPVRVELTFPSAHLDAAEVDRIRKRVGAYAVELTDGLGIPADIECAASASDNVAATAHFGLAIDGRECRMPALAHDNEQPDSGFLVGHFCESLLVNRKSFVTDKTLKAATSRALQLTDARQGYFDESEFREVLLHLIERGHSLTRLRELPLEETEYAAGPGRIAEQLMSDVRQTRIDLRFNEEFMQHVLEHHPRERSFDETLEMFRDGMYYELGVPLPQIRCTADDTLAPDEFRIGINSLVLPILTTIGKDAYLVNDSVDRLKLIDVSGTYSRNPANGLAQTVVASDDVEKCEQLGRTTWNAVEWMVLALSSKIRSNAGNFLTVDLLENSLDLLATGFPELVETTLQRHDTTELTWTLRDLLDERVSIRDLRAVLESILSFTGFANVNMSDRIVFFPEGAGLIPRPTGETEPPTIEELADFVRSSGLKRSMSSAFARGLGDLKVYLLDHELGMRIADFSADPLTDEERQQLLLAIEDEIDEDDRATGVPILTDHHSRRPLRELIRVEFPRTPVASYGELVPDIGVNPVSRISLSDA